MPTMSSTPAPPAAGLQRWLALASIGLVMAAAALLLGIGRWWGDAAPPPAAASAADDLAGALDRALGRKDLLHAGLAIRPLSDTRPTGGGVLADGVCDALGTRLARLGGLRLVPCQATRAAVATRLDDRQLARLLNVRWVLGGSVEVRSADRLRVRLALRDADLVRPDWQLDEELTLADLQALPERVAAAAGPLLGRAVAGPAAVRIADVAYADLLRARELARRPGIEDRLTALRLVEQVLAAEPQHLPAQVLHWQMRSALVGNVGPPGERETAEQMHATRAALQQESLVLAQRLIAADPGDLRAQALLMNHDVKNRRWVEAFDRMDALLREGATLPGLLRLAARLHLHAGYVKRTQELALAAARLNALDAEALEVLAYAHGARGDDAALRELVALARQIGHGGIGWAAAVEAGRRRDLATLASELAGWVGQGGRWPADWVPAYAQALATPPGSPQRTAVLDLLDSHDGGTRQHFAHYLFEKAVLGGVPHSLRAVQHHAALPPAAWLQYLWWPEMAAVRAQPGFADAMADLGLPALWARRGPPDGCRLLGERLTCP